MRCPSCESQNPEATKFCIVCGAAIKHRCAKRGVDHDLEEWRGIVASYHHAAADAIEHFANRVAMYLGEGALAFFRYPEGLDNDAGRAARNLRSRAIARRTRPRGTRNDGRHLQLVSPKASTPTSSRKTR